MKKNELKNLKKAIGQHIYVEYIVQKQPQQVVRKLLEADLGGIVIKDPIGVKGIYDTNIKNIEIKNLSFIHPDAVFFNTKDDPNAVNMHMDKVTTRAIEHMKRLPHYELMIRSAKFVKNGSLEKYKQQSCIFEMEVFHWIKKPQHLVELCPLALLNNEFLLAIYMKRFLVFKKNLSVVFADDSNDIQNIINFIFENNDKIVEERGKSLRTLAEDLL